MRNAKLAVQFAEQAFQDAGELESPVGSGDSAFVNRILCLSLTADRQYQQAVDVPQNSQRESAITAAQSLFVQAMAHHGLGQHDLAAQHYDHALRLWQSRFLKAPIDPELDSLHARARRALGRSPYHPLAVSYTHLTLPTICSV